MPHIPHTLEDLMNSKLGHLLLALGKDKQEISVCSPNTTVGEALKTMAERCTLSLPILDDPVNNKFVGFVDVMSLVRALVMYVQPESRDPTDTLASRVVHFNKVQLKDVLPAVEGNADSCVSPSLVLNATFKDALGPFTMASSDREWHVHRLLITTNDGRLAALFTQSDALQMLSRTPQLLGACAAKTLTDLGLVPRNVVCVNYRTCTLDAFTTMVNNRVTSLAIVDDQGQLLEVLSPSDLRGVEKLSYEDLMLTVQDFKKRPGATRKPQSPVMVEPSDTLEKCVRILSESRLHRVYIGRSGSPVGVVSITDVLTILLRL
eukprot:NODE_3277_length_1383_cov_180.516667_g2850_i0.p1 GENE.NODE_3277_length_1383_cov_180.516667_g2850_i0~~NODE_3277_length_1383_cov_180.516667_g2850_i0.p1  ORF type:complete len:320 (+),score=22.47 NODE_3277_length_1383_cov_180.516667_g2850_i0:78-1037(+)